MFKRLALEKFKPFYFPNIVPKLEPDPDDAACVEYYAGPGFAVINKAFTAGTQDRLSPKIQQSVEDLLVLITTSTFKPKLVYRGIIEKFSAKYRALKPGDRVVKPAFMSTSYDYTAAYGFSSLGGGTILQLTPAASAKCLEIEIIGEMEALYPPETHYLVTRVSTTPKGQTLIEGTLDIAPQFGHPNIQTGAAEYRGTTLIEDMDGNLH